MSNNNPPNRIGLIAFFFTLFFLSACNSYKNVAYFTDISDTVGNAKIAGEQYVQPVIQPDDVLSIIVQTLDPLSTAPVNQPIVVPSIGSSSASSIGNQQVSGFLVDKQGEVQLAMVGKVKLSGLTTDQARDLLTEKVSRFYRDPSVQVRFANFKITLLGEVAKPATYTVPNEKITVLDALGLAGDLTIYGKRENILLIRENGSEKNFVRLNINSSSIFKSPYFYLKQNDVIYVEPTKGKAASTDAARNRTITIIASLISVAIVAISRL